MEVRRAAGDLTPLRNATLQAAPAWARRSAAVALAFLAFFAMSDFGLSLRPEYGALAALLLLSSAGARPWRELWAMPFTRGLALFIGFLIVHAAYAATIEPRSSYSEQLTVVAKLVKLGVFSCVTGWWLSLMPRAIPRLLILMIFGLLAAVLYHLPWESLPRMFDGSLRPEFGITENLSGLLAAVGGWLTLCLLIGTWRSAPRGGLRAGLLAIGLLVYAGAFLVLIFSQSRGAWLAFAVAVPLAVAAGVLARRRNRRYGLPWPPLAWAALVSLLLLASAHGIFALRFAGAERLLDSATAALIGSERGGGVAVSSDPSVASDREDPSPAHASASASQQRAATVLVPMDVSTPGNKAASVRLQLYEYGMALARERPWFGWGLDTVSRLVASAPPELIGEHHVHLHNAYLDALVGIGVVGAGLLLIVFLMLLQELVQASRTRVITMGSFWAIAGALAIVLVANLFDSLLWRFDYSRAPLEVLFGCCIAYGIMRRRTIRDTPEIPSPLSAGPRS